MNTDTALWVGITAGFILGGTATWITLGIAIALGRHLERRATALRAVINEPPTDTFDNNLRALIRQHQKKP